MFNKVDSIIIPNYKDYWVCPLINKYLPDAMKKYEGTLILKKNKKNIFISHPFNYNQSKKNYSKIKNLTILNYNDGEEYKKIINKYCGKNIGHYGKFLSVGTLNCLKKFLCENTKKKLIDVSKSIDESRNIKEKFEIINIKKAVRETKKVLELVKKKLKVGVSEIELQKFIENEFEKNGFEKSFCIVAFGKNASNLHHVSGKTKLKKNQCILIDTGCKYNGYCSDLTQSFWFGEKNNKEFNEYNAHLKIVQNSIKKIEKKLKSEIKAKELMNEVNWNLAHAIGHGIGLETHDFPTGIGNKSNWELKENMVIAIEPGYYNKKFGIRIENNYLILKNSFEKL